jgi:hypothetical protein
MIQAEASGKHKCDIPEHHILNSRHSESLKPSTLFNSSGIGTHNLSLKTQIIMKKENYRETLCCGHYLATAFV